MKRLFKRRPSDETIATISKMYGGEDDGVTGYLYVSDRKREQIVRHLQVTR